MVMRLNSTSGSVLGMQPAYDCLCPLPLPTPAYTHRSLKLKKNYPEYEVYLTVLLISISLMIGDITLSCAYWPFV